MNITKVHHLFKPSVIKKYSEVTPLLMAASFGAILGTGSMIFELITRTDAKWNRWNSDEQYTLFNDNNRVTQVYWVDKPEDTAPELIKQLRQELAKPPAL